MNIWAWIFESVFGLWLVIYRSRNADVLADRKAKHVVLSRQFESKPAAVG